VTNILSSYEGAKYRECGAALAWGGTTQPVGAVAGNDILERRDTVHKRLCALRSLRYLSRAALRSTHSCLHQTRSNFERMLIWRIVPS